MGAYVNPGNEVLEADMRQDIYIDKSKIITELNKVFGSSLSRVCVSRPRRFGKTMVTNLIAAYYSRSVDTRPIFEKLLISQQPDWDARLNKCNVIKIDLGEFYSRYHNEGGIIKKLNERVVAEMRYEFSEVNIPADAPIADAIIYVYERTKVPFVVIMDEYDVMVRERVPQTEFTNYLSMLNDLFKSQGCSRAIGLAYITGIIPIVRDRVQSKLNNFREYTMLMPRDFAPYIGFTLDEVKGLCERYNMDYEECLRWYDGYKISEDVSICNSNSVCEALTNHKFANYWNKTGAYAAISDYIQMNFKGIKEDIATMIGGGSVPVTVDTFTNVLSDLGNKDKVFTYLIHLGYLAYSEDEDGFGYCHIPNGEIRTEWKHAMDEKEDFSTIMEMVANSRELLQATLDCDEEAVAEALADAHDYVTSAKTYNNEGSLQSAVGLAYFYATTWYTIAKEFPSGRGYADMAFIPYVPNKPAIIIELKVNTKPSVGLKQIIKKHYADGLNKYKGDLYFVAISYDKETREHTCKIEKSEV